MNTWSLTLSTELTDLIPFYFHELHNWSIAFSPSFVFDTGKCSQNMYSATLIRLIPLPTNPRRRTAIANDRGPYPRDDVTHSSTCVLVEVKAFE